MSETKVTKVRITTNGYGLEVKITVRRDVGVGGVGKFPDPRELSPRPADVPEDVRRALSVWLAGNQP